MHCRKNIIPNKLHRCHQNHFRNCRTKRYACVLGMGMYTLPFPSIVRPYLSPYLSLDMRRNYHLLNFMNLKLVKGDKVFKFDSWKDNRTRGGSRLEMCFPHTEMFKKSLSYYGPRISNELPLECKQNHMPNSHAKKRSLKKYFLTKFKERGSVGPRH